MFSGILISPSFIFWLDSMAYLPEMVLEAFKRLSLPLLLLASYPCISVFGLLDFVG